MKNLSGALIISCCLLACASSRMDTSAPTHLQCMYRTNPVGLTVEAPFFTWWMESGKEDVRQSGWQIQVATDSTALLAEENLLWDSGRQDSGREIQAHYAGPALAGNQTYYWRVRTWDQQEAASAYSAIASWETGPDSWQASWISDGSEPFEDRADFFADHPSPLFRKNFELEEMPSEARLHIVGLGYYEAYLNGEKTGAAVLDPGWTDYGERTLYSTFDVREQLHTGANTLGVMLGNGWYNPMPIDHFARWNLREILTIGQPKLIAELHLTFPDGQKKVIVSDNSWKHGDSWILYNDVYLGERQDGRRKIDNWAATDFDDQNWPAASTTTAPGGRLVPQLQPAIEITKRLPAQKVTQLAPGVHVVDFGQNFAGWIRLQVRGEAGDSLRLRYGELLHEDGSVNGLTTVATQLKEAFGLKGGPGVPPTAWQEDNYIIGGQEEEVYQQHFTFHGFRYVQIWGYPGDLRTEDIEGLRLNANLPQAGQFQCSNEDFNRLQEVCDWTFMSNVFSIESDCPGREKFGYGGDMVTAGEAYIFNYDMANFYRKAVQDFADDVRPLGGMPEIAPDVGIDSKTLGDGSGPIGWQLAFPFLQDLLYRFYGDRQLLERHYPACKRLVAFLESVAENNRINIGLSDHALLNEKPEAFTSTAFYYHIVQLTARFARILEHPEDAEKYEQLATTIHDVILVEEYNPENGCFANCNQTAQSVALWYDFMPTEEREMAWQRLEDSIRTTWNGHLSTGIFGTKMMLDVFRRDYRDDLAFEVTNQPDFPGWRNMLANGATTLWESWRGQNNGPSHNHPMFGSISEWFYRSVLGINPTEDAVACDRWILSPQLTEQIPSASGQYTSIRGIVSSEYRRTDQMLEWEVRIPPNTDAILEIPFSGFERPEIRVNDQVIFSGGDIRTTERLQAHEVPGDLILLPVGNGHFKVQIQAGEN
ncbi:family 78 glycoside hydrolase catalytic domain [Flavilitoribacter nigricans]|uniref:alpha-L-rhamnosidase n=1 Tax=Flavilitoribacter nigricans (strain ATCC 23147 / DSM 23189 / NBRC 102662 / NCIMB 1420 / SS-2) TaxID=1122177 RepID=A0A2D0NIK2_FLAN2|nr:family 78 glycoside hydrolase catalytic domain [Flavilitoribacter nigricans]PHN08268.1 alpha-L-rhamnosidase [Flavilitoribacter nigricans DSM 23189 = NBRC 102662]